MRRGALTLLVVLCGALGCGGSDGDEAAARRRAADARVERQLALGRRVFARHCRACHTLAGRRYTKPVIEWEAPNLDEVRLKRHYVEWRIEYGGPAMASFSRAIPPRGVAAAIAYVTATAGRHVRDGDPPRAQLAAGRALFAQHCAACHGIAGDPMTGRPDYPGVDFNLVKPSERLVRTAVREGVAPDVGLMPAFAGRLASADVAAVAAYVNAVAAEGPEAPRTPFEARLGE
jgi:cytochrome c oxidase cbb3-type subunit 3